MQRKKQEHVQTQYYNLHASIVESFPVNVCIGSFCKQVCILYVYTLFDVPTWFASIMLKCVHNYSIAFSFSNAASFSAITRPSRAIASLYCTLVDANCKIISTEQKLKIMQFTTILQRKVLAYSKWHTNRSKIRRGSAKKQIYKMNTYYQTGEKESL